MSTETNALRQSNRELWRGRVTGEALSTLGVGLVLSGLAAIGGGSDDSSVFVSQFWIGAGILFAIVTVGFAVAWWVLGFTANSGVVASRSRKRRVQTRSWHAAVAAVGVALTASVTSYFAGFAMWTVVVFLPMGALLALIGVALTLVPAKWDAPNSDVVPGVERAD